jgi:hypothetical protein
MHNVGSTVRRITSPSCLWNNVAVSDISVNLVDTVVSRRLQCVLDDDDDDDAAEVAVRSCFLFMRLPSEVAFYLCSLT